MHISFVENMARVNVDDPAPVPPVETAFPTIPELKRQAAEKTACRKAEGRKPFDDLCGVLSGSPALSA